MTQDQIRVVIIDDDLGVLDMLTEAITAFGHRAFPASNAVQGLREVRERQPLVVLLDLAMPGLDGHSVFDRLIGTSTSLSIVIVSGSNDEDAARAFLQRGAFDYIAKPVDLAHLQSVIIMAAAAAQPG